MDHYQTHTHPYPTTPHTTGVHSTSPWSPKLQWAKDWQHINFSHPTHHFHFPALSIHDFRSKVENVSHLAQPPGPASKFAPWVPDADIRDAKKAYHIEIEVPGVTDKTTLAIQWLSPRTLLVRGDIKRPKLAGKAAEEDKDSKQDVPTEAQKSQEVSQEPPQVADGASTNPGAASAATQISPWEKLDLDWCELTKTQEKDKLTNENVLQRVLSYEPGSQEADADVLTFLLSERKVGAWQRTFTLPLDVDMKALKATLIGGLLSIELPKREMTGEPKVNIDIQ